MVNCRDLAVLSCALLRRSSVPATPAVDLPHIFIAQTPSLAFTWITGCVNTGKQTNSVGFCSMLRWARMSGITAGLQSTRITYHETNSWLPEKPGNSVVQGRLTRIASASKMSMGNGLSKTSLVQDLAALNKMELLCWDGWGLADREAEDDVLVEDAALLNLVATLTLADNSAFLEMRNLYENESRLGVPEVIRSYTRTGLRMVTLTNIV